MNDQFADQSNDNEAVGKPAVYFLRFTPADNPVSDAHFSYDGGVLTLTFATKELHGKIGIIDLVGSMTMAANATATNAMGGRFPIQVWRKDVRGFAFDACRAPSTEGSATCAFVPMLNYTHIVSLAPSLARQVASDVAVRIEGVYVLGPTAHVGFCEQLSKAATIRDPAEITGIGCYATVEIRRVTFVRASSNEVIHDWRSDR